MTLKIINGTYGYVEGEPLFSQLDFEVKEGNILTILGANGVGKTTLLKCILRFYKWLKGDTFINGICSDKMSHTEFWKYISYVPQAKNSIFPYSVLDMVLMGRAPNLGFMTMPKKEDIEIAERVIEEVGISKLIHQSCGAISGGELQLVLIARALVSEPKILIMDEPESNLDMKNQLLILDIIQRLKKEKGITCIINTHYPNHALRISDDTLILGKEKKHIFGTTKSVITEENIKRYFDVSTEIIHCEHEGKNTRILFPIKIAN